MLLLLYLLCVSEIAGSVDFLLLGGLVVGSDCFICCLKAAAYDTRSDAVVMLLNVGAQDLFCKENR